MKKEKIKKLEILLIAVILIFCVLTVLDNGYINNVTSFILLLILPFVLLCTIELIKIVKEINSKQENNNTIEEIPEEKVEQIINNVLEEKQEEDSKKVQEETIQIPITEIQKQINTLNKELHKEKDLEKTEVLFNKEDIKEIIKKELESTKTVDKVKKKY